ncbi:MAG TPA: SPOR domain-containing protein [Acidobacteriaceae bacterium]|jgi:cell division septation protein DedD|nr:SPOR domain-containing protein [Acidobacteriaceae bacterium]
MNRLLDDENDLLQQRDRELTLSTGAILAIFLGLVLLCAVFFGFGYNLGRKSTSPTTPIASESASEPAAQPSATQPSSSAFDNFKPSPSSPAAAAATTPSSPPPIDLPPSPSSASSVTVPTSPAPKPEASAPQPITKPAANTTLNTTTKTTKPAAPAPPPATPRKPAATTPPTPAATHTAPPPPIPASSTPAVAPSGAFLVQVAAVSRQDDANLLVTALRAKGYQVVAHLSPQDKLIHIQVGPYATRRDAEVMREKLIMDGYNAIVK